MDLRRSGRCEGRPRAGDTHGGGRRVGNTDTRRRRRAPCRKRALRPVPCRRYLPGAQAASGQRWRTRSSTWAAGANARARYETISTVHPKQPEEGNRHPSAGGDVRIRLAFRPAGGGSPGGYRPGAGAISHPGNCRKAAGAGMALQRRLPANTVVGRGRKASPFRPPKWTSGSPGWKTSDPLVKTTEGSEV